MGWAQNKSFRTDSQVWLQYFLNVRLNEKLSVNADAGYRRTDGFVNVPLQWLARVGASYHFNDVCNVSVGYAYFSLHSITPKNSFDRSEHRPWVRFNYLQRFGRFQIQHRARLEMRNIQDSDQQGVLDNYNSYFRAGYQLNCQYVLTGDKIEKNAVFLIAYDELFVNFGSDAPSYYDQNRLYFGIGYGVSANTNLTLGYQYILSHPNEQTFLHLNTVRFNLVQNFDLRKRKSGNKIDNNENKETD
jgi:hypothetical protein